MKAGPLIIAVAIAAVIKMSHEQKNTQERYAESCKLEVQTLTEKRDAKLLDFQPIRHETTSQGYALFVKVTTNSFLVPVATRRCDFDTTGKFVALTFVN